MVRTFRKCTVLLLCGVGAFFAAGCETKPIAISYYRPAQYKIPSSVKKLAIVRFGGKGRTERKYGEIASDKLASTLNAYNQRYKRFELYDRKRVSAIMDERDFQLSITDTDEAVKLGKIAKVDAMIYGTVYVVAKDERLTKQYYDWKSETTKTRSYIRRYASAAVTFTMDDIHTTKTLCTVTITNNYDSDKGQSSWMGTDPKLLPTDQVVDRLIQMCVDQFIPKISPHQVFVNLRFEKGKSKAVKEGNKFALEREFGDALEYYRMGLVEKPEDHGAMFNIGACYEGMGNLKKAREYYNKAIKMKPEKKYIKARRRVRLEGQRIGNR
ncbi:MAG: tetratricopeptide repeat protein [Phycisphaerae bacterium]|nr:tetratricopeptide repeat protein [Phycisphaerae bacterium]